jgi:hypothetical protein
VKQLDQTNNNDEERAVKKMAHYLIRATGSGKIKQVETLPFPNLREVQIRAKHVSSHFIEDQAS